MLKPRLAAAGFIFATLCLFPPEAHAILNYWGFCILDQQGNCSSNFGKFGQTESIDLYAILSNSPASEGPIYGRDISTINVNRGDFARDRTALDPMDYYNFDRRRAHPDKPYGYGLDDLDFVLPPGEKVTFYFGTLTPAEMDPETGWRSQPGRYGWPGYGDLAAPVPQGRYAFAGESIFISIFGPSGGPRDYQDLDHHSFEVVPEPGTLALFAGGLLVAAGGFGRRRGKDLEAQKSS